VRLWLGFWRGLTAFRMAVFNILFLLVLALIVGLVSSVGGDRLVIQDETTLVLSPRGMVVEEYSGTPLERMINEALGQQSSRDASARSAGDAGAGRQTRTGSPRF
jgi:protease IV